MKKTALLIALVSFFSALLLNEYNLIALKKDGIPLRENQTVITADDISYLRPALNFLTHGELKDNTPGAGSYLVRSPGYSSVLIVLGYFFGEKNLLQILKYFQLLLFAISIYFLFFISFISLNNKLLSILISSFYGVSGIAFGFVFYTLTEGVTPMLIIFFVYFLLRAKIETREPTKITFYIVSAITLSVILVSRPVLGIMGLSIPFLLVADFRNEIKKLIILTSFVFILMFSLLTVWLVRNYYKTGQHTGLYPIYYSQNSMSCFRPTHQALWDLCKSWGLTGQKFHSVMVPFWSKAISGDSVYTEIQNIISIFPPAAIEYLGKDNIRGMLTKYRNSIFYQKQFYDRAIPMPVKIPEIEQETIQKITQLTQSFRSHFWFQYHILSPLKVFKELAFHSNLSLYVFQKTFRNSPLMELLRMVCFLVHAGGFLFLVLALFVKNPFYTRAIMTIPVILYVFFLIYIQRGVEERYTLPILSLILINMGMVLQYIWVLVKKTFIRKP